MTNNVIPLFRLPTPDPSRLAGLRLARLRHKLGLSQADVVELCPAVGSLRTLQRMERAQVSLTALELLGWLEDADLEGRKAA